MSDYKGKNSLRIEGVNPTAIGVTKAHKKSIVNDNAVLTQLLYKHFFCGRRFGTREESVTID